MYKVASSSDFSFSFLDFVGRNVEFGSPKVFNDGVLGYLARWRMLALLKSSKSDLR
jgi:hypothetical protein